jgi:O-Antigen ligase
MGWRRVIETIGARGSLRGLARWLFLATLVIAPWLYGGTTAWSIELIDGLLGAALGIWIISFLLEWRWPLVPRGLLLITAFILIQGWWMVANAHAIYDSRFGIFATVHSIVPNLAGSKDYVLSFAWMLRATALAGAVCLVAEMTRRPVWLLRLWYAVAIAGGSIAALGLIQKATNAEMIFWQHAEPWEAKSFFATYYYHANAGAFLDLVLPVVAGLALWAWAQPGRAFSRPLWITTLLIVTVAVVSNTSRMAQAVALLIVIVFMGAIMKRAVRLAARVEKRSILIGVFIVIVAVLAIGQAAHLDKPLARWQTLTKQLPSDARWVADRAAFGALGEAGPFGFGPGTFRSIFPHYQLAAPSHPQGIWRFLHNDPLQTILEWGWLGSVAIGALFFGAIGIAIRNYLGREDWSNRQRILLPCVILALIGVAIHALVDFPLQIFSIQLVAATYLGVCWGSSRWGKKFGIRKSEVGGGGRQ